jgi:ribosomal protein L36
MKETFAKDIAKTLACSCRFIRRGGTIYAQPR